MVDLSKDMIKRLGSWPDRKFLGTVKDVEFYCCDGEIYQREPGSLIISLIDIREDAIEQFYMRANKLFDSNECLECSPNNIQRMLLTYKEFALEFIELHSFLSSYHLALRNELLTPFMPVSIKYTIFSRLDLSNRTVESSLDKFIEHITKIVFNGEIQYSHFSQDGLLSLFTDTNIICDPLFTEFAGWLAHYYVKFIDDIRIIKTSLMFLVPEILLRNDKGDLPFTRYKNLIEGWISSKDCISSLDLIKDYGVNPTRKRLCDATSAIEDFLSALNDPQIAHKTVLLNKHATEYDESHGYRTVFLYEINSVRKAAFTEFEDMCLNNVELSTCKNCGKLFWATSKAVRFCNRSLDNDTEETCRTTSAQWYAENRKSSNPANQMYTLYKKRYHSRVLRNRVRNPYDRFADWDQYARLLVRAYEDGKISYDEFEKEMIEKDKDMKPLDKL